MDLSESGDQQNGLAFSRNNTKQGPGTGWSECFNTPNNWLLGDEVTH